MTKGPSKKDLVPTDSTTPERRATSSEIVFYQGEDGQSRIEVRLQENNVWLSQRLIGELFQKDVRTISEHISNIFEEGELDAAATIRKFRIVRSEGSPAGKTPKVRKPRRPKAP